MEIEKVVRILTFILVAAAFALKVATRLMFPYSSGGFNLPLIVTLLLCLTIVWRETAKTEKNSNR